MKNIFSLLCITKYSIYNMHLCFDEGYRRNTLSCAHKHERILQTKMIENAYLMYCAHQSLY